MPLRILSDNRADSAVLTVSGAVAGMGSDKLKSDLRGEFCRIAASSSQIVATWPASVPVGAMVLPQSTLGPSSKIRVRLYADAAGTQLKWDSGERWAAPGTTSDNEGWSENLNTNSAPSSGNDFAYCIAPSVAVYLRDQLMAQRVAIDISDPGASLIDIGRLLIGPYMQPAFNASYGQSSQLIDMSTHTRTAGGSLRTERGPIANSLSFSLGYVAKEDRGQVRRLMEQSIGKSLWVSLCADSGDKEFERDKSIYGRVTRQGSMQWERLLQHSVDFQIEGH